MKHVNLIMVLMLIPVLMGEMPHLKPAKNPPKKVVDEVEEFLNDKKPIKDPFDSLLPKPEKEAPPPVVEPPPRIPEPVVPQPVNPAMPVQEVPKPVQEFLPPPIVVEEPKLVVSGLIWDTERPQAIINDQVVTVGDQLGEMTVTKITRRGVEVKLKGKLFNFEN